MKTIKQVVYLTLTLAGPMALTSVDVFAAAPVSDISSDSSSDRISRIERMINQSNQQRLAVQQQLDTLIEEVNLLRGDTEVHSHKLEQLVERQRELYQELEDRFSRFSANKQQPNQPTAVTASTAPVEAEKEPEIVYSDDIGENEAYDKAMNLVLKERRYDKAIPEFRAFIKAFPDSDYAPNAYYWLGQLLFNKGNYREAKVQFEQVDNFYPDSNKRSDAILKLGSIALKNNNVSEAKRNFEKVIAEYPGSTSAKLATSRLQSLK
jgi:tol-pal system protein YbgF